MVEESFRLSVFLGQAVGMYRPKRAFARKTRTNIV